MSALARRREVVALVLTCLAWASSCSSGPLPSGPPAGPGFIVEGRPFRFAGANTYFLMYEMPERIDAALDAAVGAGATVIRTWAFYDVVSPGDSPHGFYIQSYDVALGRPVVNHGPNGFGRLDLVMKKVSDRGLKLMVSLTNGWQDFGGVDRWVEWLAMKEGGQPGRKDFFTSPVIRQWFKTQTSGSSRSEGERFQALIR